MSKEAYQSRYMIRRRREEPHENHERWVISYADFITLLFAFFVVMYSISSVNEGKYRVLSDSLVSVFNSPPRSFDPITVGDKDVFKSNDQLVKLAEPGEYPSKEDYQYGVEGALDDTETKAVHQGENTDDDVDYLSKLSEQLAFAMQQHLADGDVEITNMGEWIEVNIKASVLYSSGSAALSSSAKAVLADIAEVLTLNANSVQVEGHTDDIPIETPRYPSNWELSAARAAVVVRHLASLQIEPARMAAVGYGEFHPIASNDSEDGRAKNRRIALIISKDQLRPSAANSEAINESSTGASPSVAPTAEPPLRIRRLENGGLLFSNDQPSATP